MTATQKKYRFERIHVFFGGWQTWVYPVGSTGIGEGRLGVIKPASDTEWGWYPGTFPVPECDCLIPVFTAATVDALRVRIETESWPAQAAVDHAAVARRKEALRQAQANLAKINKVVLPIIRQVQPGLVADDLIGVQPMFP